MKQLLITTIAAVVLLGCGTTENFSQPELLQRQITDEELKAIGDLHLAVEEGDLNIVRNCLKSGTDIECVRGKASFRVLHRAAEAGNMAMVRLLIQKQAKVNAMAVSGLTPLDLAYKKGNIQVVKFIRKHGGKTGEELKAEGK